MKATATKASAVVVAAPIDPKLEVIAAQVAGALQETASLSETLGELTREAGKIIAKKPEQLEPFVDACKQLCAASGLTEGSFKVYLSNIRGVLRGMVEGFAPKAGQTLRSMYESVPKGTGRQKATGARTDKAPASTMNDVAPVTAASAAIATAKQSAADAKRAAIIALFGHCDDELMAAVAWAAKNETSFVRYVKANVEAASKPAEKIVVGLGKGGITRERIAA